MLTLVGSTRGEPATIGRQAELADTAMTFPAPIALAPLPQRQAVEASFAVEVPVDLPLELDVASNVALPVHAGVALFDARTQAEITWLPLVTAPGDGDGDAAAGTHRYTARGTARSGALIARIAQDRGSARRSFVAEQAIELRPGAAPFAVTVAVHDVQVLVVDAGGRPLPTNGLSLARADVDWRRPGGSVLPAPTGGVLDLALPPGTYRLAPLERLDEPFTFRVPADGPLRAQFR